jgi:hypothetical protein
MNDVLSGIMGIAVGVWMLISGVRGLHTKDNVPKAYKVLSLGQIICGGFGVLFILWMMNPST